MFKRGMADPRTGLPVQFGGVAEVGQFQENFEHQQESAEAITERESLGWLQVISRE